MEKPKYDGGPGGCPNDDCPAGHDDYSVTGVESFANSPNFAGKRRSDSDFSGWPTAGDVTHICIECGFWFYGTTEELDRRREAAARRREKSLAEREARHEELVENGWDPVCGDGGLTEEGWENVQSEMTPALSLCVAMTHMPSDIPLDALKRFTDRHVKFIGGDLVERQWTSETVRDWGFENLAEYDVFKANASDFM